MACPRPNSYLAVSNSSGNSTVTPTRANQGVALTVTGSAGTRRIILSTAGSVGGDYLTFMVSVPATQGIILDFRNSSSSGAQLLPDQKFPDKLYTTDGEITSAALAFIFTGSVWKYVNSQIPA